MSTIEAAAREIVNELYMGKDWSQVEPHEVFAIISRHLFPAVEPKDVQFCEWYWVVMPGHELACREPWFRDGVPMFGSNAASECEVRGPIPMPERDAMSVMQ